MDDNSILNKGFTIDDIKRLLISLYRRIESIRGRAPEITVFVLWSAIHFAGMLFHERWYGEAVAWQIARNATIEDILFTVPHYEGHPQLWHLLLVPFAKLGAPYDLSLSVVSYVFMAGAVAVILFHTALPRIVRLSLPFSFFILYQYSVVSRPYSMLAFALLLAAVLHKNRNEKPLRYVLCMAFMCLTSAYGIIIAGSLCLIWTAEICRGRKISEILRSIVSDRRVWCLAALLIYALLLVYMIMPYGTAVVSARKTDPAGFFQSLMYVFFMMPGDSLATFALKYNTLLWSALPTKWDIAPAVIVTLILFFIVAVYGRRRRTALYFFVPFTLFAAFCSYYMSRHHIGICLLIILFWAVITADKDDERQDKLSDKTRSRIRTVTVWFASVISVVSVYQGIAACIMDCMVSYYPGKDIAEFISQNDLDGYRIMSEWGHSSVYDEASGDHVTYMCIDEQMYADTINAYMGHNIFCNYHGGKDEGAYTNHILPDQEYVDTAVAEWKNGGYPDILVGNVDLGELYDSRELSTDDYVIVYNSVTEAVWKGVSIPDRLGCEVRMRRELAEELGFI